MRSKCIPMLIQAALFLAAALPIAAQSNPSAFRGGWPLVVGGGISRFNTDFPHQTGSAIYMEGPTLWAQWTRIPFFPRRLGVEAEYRRLSMGAPSGYSQLASNAFLGGPTYTWKFPRLALAGKGLMGYGSMDFPPFGAYTHDTRTIYALGADARFRVWDSLWAQAGYEYQWWPTLFGKNGIHPNGFTFGLAYDFRTIHQRF